jgi:glucose/arabinose dehydrogenase
MRRPEIALLLVLAGVLMTGCESAASPAAPGVDATQPGTRPAASPISSAIMTGGQASATAGPSSGSGGGLAGTTELLTAAPGAADQPPATDIQATLTAVEPITTPIPDAPTAMAVPLNPEPTMAPSAAAPLALAPAPSPIAQPVPQTAAALPPSVGLQLVAEGMSAPVALVPAPDNSGRLFVVDQTGVIWIIGADGKLKPQPFLDIRDRLVRLSPRYDERGLLGLAFHPDFANNKRFYVYYVAPLRAGGPPGWDSTSHLSEFTVTANNADQADAASERILMQIDEPESNHKGGTVVFGPDGYLYLSLGEGGGANDTGMGHTPGLGNAQDLSKPLGKILRIDVNGRNHGQYSIPADNPFASGPVPEIFAYGLRNPYRISFDMGGDHALYAADAGQDLFEEVDIITRGGNYGWNIREGMHCFDPNNASTPPATCPDTGARGEPLIAPILEYNHQQVGIVDVGGYVYRGQALPGLVGRYIFGDWSTGYASPDGTLLVASRPAGGAGPWGWQKVKINGSPNGKVNHFVLGFGQDESGEIYVLTADTVGPTGNTGKVYKIVPGQ